MKKLKSKILVGLLFFLVLILLLSLTGIFSIYYLSSDSKEIIKDNYASIEYCTNMLNSLENIFNDIVLQNSSNNIQNDLNLEDKIIQEQRNFEKFFQLQQNNITEVGEKKLVTEVANSYQQLTSILKSLRLRDIDITEKDVNLFQSEYLSISKSIKEIYKLNMAAIYKKNQTAESYSR